MKRIAIARLFQETSSFSTKKTTLDDFRQFGLHFGESVFRESSGLRDEIDGFVKVAREEKDLELIPIMWAVGWTGGILTADTFEYLKRNLLRELPGLHTWMEFCWRCTDPWSQKERTIPRVIS